MLNPRVDYKQDHEALLAKFHPALKKAQKDLRCDFEEIKSIANLVFVLERNRFDESCGVPFDAWFIRKFQEKVLNTIRDAMAGKEQIIVQMEDEALEAAEDKAFDLFGRCSLDTPDGAIEAKEMMAALRARPDALAEITGLVGKQLGYARKQLNEFLAGLAEDEEVFYED